MKQQKGCLGGRGKTRAAPGIHPTRSASLSAPRPCRSASMSAPRLQKCKHERASTVQRWAPINAGARGHSLKRNTPLLGTCSRTVPRALS